MRHLALIAGLLVLTPTLTGCDDEPAETDPVDEDESDETADDSDSVDGEPDADDDPEIAEDLGAGETAHFGEPFTIEDDPVALTDALDELDGTDDGASTSTVKVEASIQRVCQNKGCWFTLEADDVDRPVRVRMKDYGFLIPRNTEDGTSIIEGTLEPKTIDEELARHYAEDVAEETGEDPEEVDGPVDTYRLTATGIEMSRPES